MSNSLKEEFIEILAPIFGEGIRNILEKYYQEGEYEEMTAVAEHMLIGYLGEKAGHVLMKKVLVKHPNKKKR